MVEQQGAQSGKLLASSSSSRATVKTTGHHVTVPGVLIANRRIHD